MAGQYILVVAADDVLQMLLATYLEELGFEVTAAGSGAEARDKMGLLGSVVVGAIIDGSLPGAQGDRMLPQLRLIRANLAAIILMDDEQARFMSGLLGEPSIELLNKPFSRQQLRDALSDLGVDP